MNKSNILNIAPNRCIQLLRRCDYATPMRGLIIMEKIKWMPVIGFEDYYHISNTGLLKSVYREVSNSKSNGGLFRKKETINAISITPNGYIKYNLYVTPIKKTFLAHRLVSLAFIPNPNNLPQVNHINGIKTDNRVENLEWCTMSENALHKYRIGLARQDGEHHATLKLNWIKVREIRRLHASGEKNKHELGYMFGVHPEHINAIVAKIYWKEK